MIPAEVVGLAIITVAWTGLWWLAGGRADLSPLSCRALAVCWAVMALHEASHFQSLAMSVFYLWLAWSWAAKGAKRERTRRMLAAWRHPDDAAVTP